MSFQKYSSYKDSGVEWLGEVPAHWRLERLKRICSITPSNVDKKTYEGQNAVRLCNYTDVYYNDEITSDMDFMEATASDEEIRKFTLRAGDTIVTKDSESADDIGIPAYVPQDLHGVVCGYHLTTLRPKPGINGKFIKRLFESPFLKARFAVSANGLTRVGLSQYAIDNTVVPVAPIDEQNTIAAFLDHETARIDALVAEQKRLIELLKEKRQAVISHAVTKGLDPNVPMKDSGVEWLGEVPAHWRITRMKYVLDQNEGIQIGPFGGMLKELSHLETGYKVYGQENTISGDFSLGSRWLEKDQYKDLANYILRPGDLVLTRKGSLGNCRISPKDVKPGVIDSDTIRLRANKRLINPKYLQLLLHEAAYIQEQVLIAKRGAILAGLNTTTIADLICAIPGYSEQLGIMDWIWQKIEKIDEVVHYTHSLINLLREHRSTLISAAVTGKIDVRGWVPVGESKENDCLMAAEESASYQ